MPKSVEKYFKQVKKQNPDYDDSQAWATAWSIYCKYKNPGSPSCKKAPSEYFLGKQAMSPKTLRQMRALQRKHSLPGTLSGHGQNWELQVQNDEDKKLWELHTSVNGYRTGWGGWVLKPQSYQDKGDWSDSSSRHHYASEQHLRSKLIRLAHANPQLRPQLLPLIQETNTPLEKLASTKAIPINRYHPQKGDHLEMTWGYDRNTFAVVEVVKSGYSTDSYGSEYIEYKVIDPHNWPEPMQVGERGSMLVREDGNYEMERIFLRS